MRISKADVLVYVVDDDPLIRDVLAKLLSGLGCEVETFGRGEDCLTRMSQRVPELVFLDLVLPGMAGDACCRMIKEDRALAAVPVIIFTGADAAHEVMRSWRAGADDFLPKPVRQGQLLSKISAVREARRLPAATAPTPGAPRLLFADDSRFFRAQLGGALEQSGFHVLYARTMPEALELADQHPGAIDGVIAELALPGGGGLALARALLQRPSFTDRPLFLLAGSTASVQQSLDVRDLTGQAPIDKKNLPVEVILAKVNAAMRRGSSDLRAAERVPFFSVVEFRGAEETEWLSGFSYDVTSGGLFVRSMTPLPTRSSVELKVKFTFRASAKTASGLVVWANPYRARASFSYPFGMGIRFTWLDAEDADAVSRLVKLGARAA